MRKLLNDDLAIKVTGGKHLATNPQGFTMWIDLVDRGYVEGKDPLYDQAYNLEKWFLSGCSWSVLVSAAMHYWGGFSSRESIEAALGTKGPAYMADCIRNLKG